MRKNKKVLYPVVLVLLFLLPLSGCTKKAFSQSDGLDDNGYWKKVTATDYVDVESFKNLTIPHEVHAVSDELVQQQVEYAFSSLSSSVKEVTDRAIVAGDKVNIDFVGSVDGVEFEGGSSKGAVVTAGSQEFIDDFLTQIIGHTPGETMDIVVSFPDEYPSNTDLQGKEAHFETKLNFIAENEKIEVTDALISEKFGSLGWNTKEELETGIRTEIQKEAVENYVKELFANSEVKKDIPKSVAKYQEESLIAVYSNYAKSYEMTTEEFIKEYLKVESSKELIEKHEDDLKKNSIYSLAIQAVAEDADIKVTDEEIETYLGAGTTEKYQEEYGKQFLKRTVLTQKVVEHIVENATLADA